MSPLDGDLRFKLEDQSVFQAIECRHSDTYDSTGRWVPDVKLAVCSDVVYQVHQMLCEANTKAKRDEWMWAAQVVEDLGPAYAVPGYRLEEEVDGGLASYCDEE
ncbi:hypothetical protein BBP40_000224, partial [Aspergillus hancockii]